MRDYRKYIVVCVLMVVLAIGCSETVQTEKNRVGRDGILYENVRTVEASVTPSEEEQKKKEVAQRLAKLKMRSVQISLDGATADVHEKLRKRGDWEIFGVA